MLSRMTMHQRSRFVPVSPRSLCGPTSQRAIVCELAAVECSAHVAERLFTWAHIGTCTLESAPDVACEALCWARCRLHLGTRSTCGIDGDPKDLSDTLAGVDVSVGMTIELGIRGDHIAPSAAWSSAAAPS